MGAALAAASWHRDGRRRPSCVVVEPVRGPARRAGDRAARRRRHRCPGERRGGRRGRRQARRRAGRRAARSPPPASGACCRSPPASRTAAIEAALGTDVAVVRAMPNTPALVRAGRRRHRPGPPRRRRRPRLGRGASSAPSAPSCGCPRPTSTPSPACPAPARPTCSSSPRRSSTRAWLAGLPRDVSEALTTQLLVGSATLLARSGESPGRPAGAVTSPGGTTAAGLRVLDAARVPRRRLLDAVVAATERSRELGASVRSGTRSSVRNPSDPFLIDVI